MASTHSGDSIRNDAQAKRKVFKNVLDSPFVMKWPAVPNDVGQSVLTHLISLLEPIGNVRRSNSKKNLKKTSATEQPYPELNERLCTGNNTVSKLLEDIIKEKKMDDHGWTVFVCKRDIQPTQLCNHLLPMCSMAKAKIVPLPENSVVKIGKALNITRVSVLALQIKKQGEDVKEERLRLSIEDVPDQVQAQWLDDATRGTYQPTSVKILQTTAPIKPKKPQQQQQQQQQQSKKQSQQQKRSASNENNSNNNQPSKKVKRQ